MRLFGIMIANGFSSEVRVSSNLLGKAPDIETTLAVHCWQGDPKTPDRVAASARASVQTMDFGWRPNPDATRENWKKAASWGKLMSSLPKLVQMAKRSNADVIYSSQQRWDCTAATLVAAALQKPQVIHLYYVPGPWLGALPQHRLKRAPCVVSCSEFTRECAIRHGTPSRRVHTVLNPVPLHPEPPAGTRASVRSELGFGDAERVLGFIARLSETKGQRETIEAFARIANACPTARLVLVGDGLIRRELEALASKLGVGQKVVFTGARSDLPALMAAFDVFVHPSYEDPLPLAVLEAQAAGLPVAAFSDGGLPEMIVNEETGLLSPSRDIGALANHLQRLIEDPELCRRLGEAGARRVLNVFDAQRSADTLSKVLHSAARGSA